ncbi:MAG: metallophosphoesterase [Sphingomonadales bacterium]|nr:metallophosphoesterase [Sphingomonadales bacterium]MDE2170811.1 metallophosphoesterase [Sphingomonadales bacterium]
MPTLFHISDIHFGAQDSAALDWFARKVEAERPDAVICTGDLTMRGTVREFDAAERWLSSLCAPVSVEPGNHDMPYYWEMLRRLHRPFDRFHAARARVQRDVDVPGVAVISLSTIVPAQWRLNWSKGCVRPPALTQALQELGAARDAGLRLVACHHPLVDADTHGSGSTRGGRAALARLAEAGAHGVLSGHVHDPFDLQIEAGGRTIRIIGAGTLSERLRATPPSFNRLDWSVGEGLSVDVVTME